MLQLPLIFTEDEKANGLIRSYLTGRILDLVNEVIVNYVIDTDMEEPYDEDYDCSWLLEDPEFTEEIRDLFPEGFPVGEMAEAYLRLKEDLEAEEERILSPDMEYVLCRLIVEEIVLLPDDTLLPMKGRDYVYYALRLEEERDREEGMMVFDFDEEFCDFAWPEELKKAREEGRAVPSAFYILNHLEDIRFYPTLLFRMDAEEMTEMFLTELLSEMEMEDDEDGDWEEDWDEESSEEDILPFDLTWNRKSFLHHNPDEDDDFLPF